MTLLSSSPSFPSHHFQDSFTNTTLEADKKLTKMNSSSKPLKQLLTRFTFHKPHSQTTFTSTSKDNDNDNIVVTAICNSFKSKLNWNSVTRKFSSIELTSSLVERVLLNLNDLTHAKTALSFFHWSSKTHRFQHSIRSYCITVNVLVQAGLITDAKSLLESFANKNIETHAVRAVVDTLFEFVFGSHPLVFDLLVKAYAKTRLTYVAFAVCRYVEERGGFCVGLSSFNAFLHVAQRSDELKTVWEVYEHMIRKRIYPNVITLKIMIDAMCKEGVLQKNVELLDRIIGKRSSQRCLNAFM